MKITKILAGAASAAMALSAFAAVASAADYNAYIAFQTTQYSFRNEWSDGSYGQATDYFDSYIAWGNNDPETYPQYEDNFDYDIAGYVLPATYVDTTLSSDGTYTVEAKDLDWSVTGDSAFNFIQVTTDLPADDSVKITNVKLIVDGVEQASIDNPPVEGDQYLKANVVNIWNTDCPAYTGAFPTESLKVEFTVEGLGAPAADAPAADVEAPAAGDVDAATDSSKGSPDTGIEDVAVIGGLAIVAGAAIALTRKRK